MNEKEFNTKRQLTCSQSVVRFRKGRKGWLIGQGPWERGPGGGGTCCAGFSPSWGGSEARDLHPSSLQSVGLFYDGLLQE